MVHGNEHGEARINELPPPDMVRSELECLLASPDLPASDKRRDFLRFVVEEALAGRAGRLKGFTVAVEVFGRDETFDPQADPVVRLEARRLRRDLDSYYIDAGKHDPVRITIPKGSYVPHFEWQGVTPGAESIAEAEDSGETEDGVSGPAVAGGKTHRLPVRKLVFAGIIAAALGIGGYFVARPENTTQAGPIAEPAIVVLPFEASAESALGKDLAKGISEELVVDLMRFPGLRLYTSSFAGDSATMSTEKAIENGITYAVHGSIRVDVAQARVTARMSSIQTGEVLWSETFDRSLTPEALIGIHDDIASEIASVLGQPYGVLANELNNGAAPVRVSDMQSYLCVLKAFGYRRTFSSEEFAPIHACLQQAVVRDPGYSDAWAMLGWLELDAGRFEFAGVDKIEQQYEAGLQAATRALALEPENTLALKVLSSVEHYLGQYDAAEQNARKAVDLNPHDPDALAQLGWRLAVRGKFDEGIPLLRHAIGRSANPPGWYFHLVAVDLMMQGEFAQLRQVAAHSAVDGSLFSQALIAIACNETGDNEGKNMALEKMATAGLLARDPGAFMRRHGATEAIANEFVARLRDAGWTGTSS